MDSVKSRKTDKQSESEDNVDGSYKVVVPKLNKVLEYINEVMM
jgi:hypothetical protein